MMVEQQLRRVSSMSRGIGRESIGAAHAHTSTSKLLGSAACVVFTRAIGRCG
jgi:hypothetical protein